MKKDYITRVGDYLAWVRGNRIVIKSRHWGLVAHPHKEYSIYQAQTIAVFNKAAARKIIDLLMPRYSHISDYRIVAPAPSKIAVGCTTITRSQALRLYYRL